MEHVFTDVKPSQNPSRKDGERAARHIFHLREGVEEEEGGAQMHLHSTEVLGVVLMLEAERDTHIEQEIPHNSQHGQGLSWLSPTHQH